MWNRVLTAALMGSALMLTACASDNKMEEAAKPALPGSQFALRVDCGSSKDFVDKAGLKWVKDQEYKKGSWGREEGSMVNRGEKLQIKGTYSPELYQTETYDMWAYRFTLPNGKYTVQLHFAETYDAVTKPGERVFSVGIEGKVVVNGLDIVKAVGANTALVKAYEVTLVDGVLDIEFEEKEQKTIINAIEILQP